MSTTKLSAIDIVASSGVGLILGSLFIAYKERNRKYRRIDNPILVIREENMP